MISRVRRTEPAAILALIAALLAALAAAAIVSTGIGQASLSIGDVWQGLVVGDDPFTSTVVRDLRAPRILLALMVGAQLAVSGAILQGVTRNALASPDIIGITAGAGFVAVLLVLAIPDAPRELLPFVAFGGAVVTGSLVYALAWKNGLSPERLALTGIAVTAIFQAGVTAIVTLNVENNNVQLALQWLTGSLYGREWSSVLLLAPWLVIGLAVALILSHKINLLLLGDAVAAGLGMRIEIARFALLGVAVALAASAVSITGTVAFIGLIVPHVVRLLLGADHRVVIPIAALLGAALFLVADAIARTVIPTLEVPAGLLTTILGAPYFLYLITRRKTSIAV